MAEKFSVASLRDSKITLLQQRIGDYIEVLVPNDDTPGRSFRRTFARRPLFQKSQATAATDKLQSLPPEMQLEIFSHLSPWDILILARICKGLRKMLMSKTSVHTWKKARANVIPSMPECPDDISEPQYAELAFGDKCYFCQSGMHLKSIAWAARLRHCPKCTSAGFTLVSDYQVGNAPQPYGRELRRLLPHPVGNNENVVLLSKDATFKEEYKTLKSEGEKSKWRAVKKAELVATNKHAEECAKWFMDYQDKLVEERKETVLKRLRATRWSTELDENDQCDPKSLPQVVKACKNVLDYDVLRKLDRALDKYMQGAKKSRLLRERKQVLEECLPVLKEVHCAYVSSIPFDAVYPSVAEVYRMPFVNDILLKAPKSVKLTKEHLGTVQAFLPSMAQEWKEKVDGKLVDLIKQKSGPRASIDEKTVLGLATTFFTCDEDGHAALQHPRVIMHSCVSYSTSPKVADEELVVQDIVGSSYWNTSGCLTFDSDAVSFMATVVELCGFDSRVTTSLQMDEANPILECLSCHDSKQGRAVMAWSTVLAHRRAAHANASQRTIKLVLVEEPDATKARERLVELHERELLKEPIDLGSVCKPCARKGTFRNIWKHVHEEHDGTNEDVAVAVELYRRPLICHLWPPRLDLL